MGNKPLAIHELKILFKENDRNGDSTLDYSECFALANEIARREGAPPFTPQALEKVVDKFAGDDGKVNIREFEGAYMNLRNLRNQRSKAGATAPPRGARGPPRAQAAAGAPLGRAAGAQARAPPPNAGAPPARPQPSAQTSRSAGTPPPRAGAPPAKPQSSAPTPRSAATPPGRPGNPALPPPSTRATLAPRAPLGAAPKQRGVGSAPSAEEVAAAAKIQATQRGRIERQRLQAVASPPARPQAEQASKAAASPQPAPLQPAGPRLIGPRPLGPRQVGPRPVAPAKAPPSGARTPAEFLAAAAAPRPAAPSARLARSASPHATAAPGVGGEGGRAVSVPPPAGQSPGGSGAASQAGEPGLFGVLGLLGWGEDEPEPVKARPKKAGPKRKRKAKAAAGGGAEPAPLDLDALGQGFAALFGAVGQDAEAEKPNAEKPNAEDEQQAQQAQQAQPQEEVETSVAVRLMVEGISHEQLLASRPMREELEKGVKRAIIQQAENGVGPRNVRVTLQGAMVSVLIESPEGVAPDVLIRQLTSHVHALRHDIFNEVHRVPGIHAIASAAIRVTRLTIAGQAFQDEGAVEEEEGWLAGLFAPPRADSEHEADLEAVRRAAKEGGAARPRPDHDSPAAAQPRPDHRRPPSSQQPARGATAGGALAWGAVAAANAAVRRRGSVPRAQVPHHREMELPSPLLPWAPQLRQEFDREAPRRSRGGASGATAPSPGRRRGGIQNGQDPGARSELRELHGARELLLLEDPRELSEPESQESGESISGDVASSWNPAVHEHRYRYARDRAVGFSEPWGATEWTVQDWERHLGASGALASPAQRRALEEARARQRLGRQDPGVPASSSRSPPGRGSSPQGRFPSQGSCRGLESRPRAGAARAASLQGSPSQGRIPAGGPPAQAAREPSGGLQPEGPAALWASAAGPPSGGGALGAAEASTARPASPGGGAARRAGGGADGSVAALDDELLWAAPEPLGWLSSPVLARHPLLADVGRPSRSWL